MFWKTFCVCVKRIFKLRRLGGTNPSSGILYILNAKACCSGCVFVVPLSSSACTSMCGVVVVVVVGMCVCLVSVSTYICIHKLYKYIYTYIISPKEISVQPCNPKVALHRCPVWSSPPEPTLKQGALLVPLIGFLSFCFCLKPSYCSFKYFALHRIFFIN